MSCLPQSDWVRYVAGELGADSARRADAHLIHCEGCRARVLALREAAPELAGYAGSARVAADDTRAPVSPTRPYYARPVFLVGLVLALGAVGALVETRIQGGELSALDPRSFFPRALGMVFMLRDRAPGLFELALAVAATAGASGLATFGVSAVLRRWLGPALLLCALSSPGLPGAAQGLQHRFEESVRVERDQRIEGALVASGDRVEIDGVVAGDLIAAAERVVVRGVVEGNVFVFGEELEIEGRVEGSVVAGTDRARITGPVGGSLYIGAGRFDLARGGEAGRDAYVFAENASLEGRVARDVYGFVERLELRGEVGRDLELRAGALALLGGARVGGDVLAILPEGTGIEGATDVIEGETVVRSHLHERGDGLARFLRARFWVWLAVRLTAAFLFGLAIHALVPWLFEPVRPPALRTLALGLAVLIGGPVLLGLLGLTLVGLPLAVAGLFVYLTALYTAGVVVAGRLGVHILDPEPGSRRAFGLALLVGLLALAVGSSLPFFGPLIRALALVGGLGLVARAARDRYAAS